MFTCSASTSSLSIASGTFTENKAYYDGGVVYLNNDVTAKATISGGTFTSNVGGRSGSAFSCRTSSTLTISGSPTITDNTSGTITSNSYGAAISACGDNVGTINISGTPTIKNNTNYTSSSTSVIANIYVVTSSNLVLGSLGTSAYVGVYPKTLYSSGNTFATCSSGATNLDKVVNDKATSLVGSASGTNVVWTALDAAITVSFDSGNYWYYYATAAEGWSAAISSGGSSTTPVKVKLLKN